MAPMAYELALAILTKIMSNCCNLLAENSAMPVIPFHGQ